jgi:ubiquinone/menaquinone biosynthesis C-methylase UbiE
MTRTTATKIVGLDISAGMLEVGVKKLPKKCLIQLRC